MNFINDIAFMIALEKIKPVFIKMFFYKVINIRKSFGSIDRSVPFAEKI